ncbi:MAG: hypothetical protein ACHQVS_00780 [Candidatus Babeliales bacterium]
MLFPQLGPQYLDDKDRAILARMESFYAESITINQSFWGEADTDTRFYTGDQTLWNDLYGNLPANRRRQFSFNRIMRVVNMIHGHQCRNRKSIIATGVENADAKTADQFTKIILNINQQENVLETISTAFRGALVTGMNLLQIWVDYRQDPVSGNIKVDYLPYNAFLIDPFFTKHDLSDCNSLWTRKFLTKRECIALLSEHVEEIMGLSGNDSGNGRDGKFQFAPQSYNYGMKNLLTYDEYYYRTYRTQQMLVDSQTGETMEWKSNNEEGLKQFLQMYPSVTIIEQEIPTVNVALVVQGKVMYDGPNPLGIDSYPFVPVWAYYEPQSPYFPWRIQGVVRGLRDAQYLYNRRKAIELDILESQINSGFKFKENALVNPRDVWEQQGQGRGVAIKEEAQMTDVEQILPPQVPPSMIELSKILAEEISQISGVNEELLGSAMDDKAGILSMLRQGAGLTTLQGLFDNLDNAQKTLGKLMIDIIQTNYTPGKVKKILEGEEPQPQFYNKAFGVYHAVVEDGLNSSTQKQMQFAQMLQLREVGVPITDEDLLEAATLQGKSDMVENMQAQKQQAMQMQMQQMQLDMQEQMANIDLAKARATADEGLGVERYSRVQENQALARERDAAAEKDHEIGVLNVIKALKEIDSIDIDQMNKLIALSHLLKQHEMNQQKHEKEMAIPSPVNNAMVAQ